MLRGFGALSTATNIRRVALMLMQGAGYQDVNNLGTISSRNTPYTFNLAARTPNYLANYGSPTFRWSVPGCTVTSPAGAPFMVTVTVPSPGIATIQSALPMDGDAYVEVFSSVGVRVRLVRAAEQPGRSVLQVNVAGLGRGVFFAALHTGGDVIRRKFVIAR